MLLSKRIERGIVRSNEHRAQTHYYNNSVVEKLNIVIMGGVRRVKH